MKCLLLCFVTILFVNTATLLSAPRTQVSHERKKTNIHRAKSDQNTKPELSDEERDAMLITSGVGILGAVVSIFIDRHNLPHVKTQLFALLAGLQQFVSYMVRSPLSAQQEEQIVEQLLEYLEQVWPLEKDATK